MTRKVWWLAVAAGAVALGSVGWAIWPTQPTDHKIGAIEGAPAQDEAADPLDSGKNGREESPDTAFDSEQLPSGGRSSNGEEEPESMNDSAVDRYRRASERGMSAEILRQYIEYDDETLRQLAKQGDVTAINLYAPTLITREPAKAFDLLERGAKLGSVDAALQMAEAHKYYTDGEERWTPPETQKNWEARQHEIRELGWLLFGVKRGSASAAAQVSVFMRETEMSVQELEKACEFARNKYNDLQDRRIKDGLREFDDSPVQLDDRDRIRNADPCPEGLGFSF